MTTKIQWTTDDLDQWISDDMDQWIGVDTLTLSSTNPTVIFVGKLNKHNFDDKQAKSLYKKQ